MKTAMVFLLLGSLYATTLGAAQTPDRKITVAQARALVMASLTKQERRLPKLEAEHFDNPDNTSSKFLIFTVVGKGLPKGSVVAGMYAVDPYTGDVFHANKECDEVRNKRLERLQVQVRAKLRLSQSEYQRLKTNGPLCEE
ncbi:MAG: hypothetical protein JST77_00595 [Acidobacteria bacterium]|nr:hypothetical protein [Acidobacteriota bacterium]